MSPWANVSRFTDRHGHERWRFRRKGFPSVMLPGEPGSQAFMEALDRARKAPRIDVGADGARHGSFSWLCVEFYRSAAWRALSPVTQRTYRGEIERFRAKAGNNPIRDLRPANIRRFMDAKSATPAAANQLLRVLRIMMRWAVERDYIAADPTYQIKKLKPEGDGFAPWAPEHVAAFRKRWRSGTKERLAFELLLETGQRRGDVIRLGRQHIGKDGKLSLTQSKTGVRVVIPVTDELAAELACVPRDQMTFLQTAFGRPFTAAGFGNWFRSRCDKAGLTGLSAHGLRKTAAQMLAEAGSTANQIAAVTGHKSLAEVTRYTQGADREAMADEAFAKRKARTDLSNRSPSGIVNPDKLIRKTKA